MIEVFIGGVGNSHVSGQFDTASEALALLDKNDHEGSSVSATFHLDFMDPDDVYELLEYLKERGL